jgi:hypothetical protein
MPAVGGQSERILGRQPGGLREERHEADRRPARARSDEGHPLGEQRRIPAHLVDDEAGDLRGIGGIDGGLRPEDLRDDAAAVDVADDDDRRVGRSGEPHIGDVARSKVDLRRRASALDEDDVRLRPEAREAFEHRRHQLGLPRLVGTRRDGAAHAPLHDELGPDLRLRLQKDGVHVDGRRNPRGPRLKRLGPADLAAIGRHRGVVGHVLRLERPDVEAAVRQQPGEPGDKDGLADVRPGALQHEEASAHLSAPPLGRAGGKASCAVRPLAPFGTGRSGAILPRTES